MLFAEELVEMENTKLRILILKYISCQWKNALIKYTETISLFEQVLQMLHHRLSIYVAPVVVHTPRC